MEWELYLTIGFLVLAPLGLLWGGLALYQYLRFESAAEMPRVPFAMTVFAVQYGLVLILAVSLRYRLLPTILMFLTAIALISVIRLGLQAHSKAGFRIAMAGLFTLCAYMCIFGHDYLLFSESFHQWGW
jgi:hypothetical protein